MHVYVLLFNAQTQNEGIHTLKVGDRNIVLMFESEDDATRYGLMLEAQDFAVPTIEGFDSEEIEGFCQEAGYECKIVPAGTLEVPPESNVEKTDWQVASESASASAGENPEFSASELERLRRKLEDLM
jgi:hypothetical protein